MYDLAGWLCLDCRRSTHEDDLNEYYMVQFDLWAKVNPSKKGMLCIGCLEARLGRRLVPSDFIDAPINQIKGWQSERLQSRIKGDPQT